jgi:hypothetical protein
VVDSEGRLLLDADEHDPQFVALLESAARLQQRVPGLVMVGGSAAAIYARHRYSEDHDHVLADLNERYTMVLEAVEEDTEWASSTRSTPPNTILGSEGGFEAGIRQLRRSRPLEVETVVLPSGAELAAPTFAETLRIKGYLVVARNRMRDYLDVAALGDTMGFPAAGKVLADIDSYYDEKTHNGEAVSTALAELLTDAKPRDKRALSDLAHYKGLAEKWRNWTNVQRACRRIAVEMVLP